MSYTEDEINAERELPNDVQLEYALIGLMIFNNKMIDTLAFLSPEHFYGAEHQAYYQRLVEMRREGQAITPFTMAAKFAENVNVSTYLTQSVAYSSSIMNPVQDAMLIVDLAARREVILTCKLKIQEIHGSKRTIGEIITDLSNQLTRIDTGGAERFKTDKQVTQNILKKLQNPQKPHSTGIGKLDVTMDGGLYPGMTYVLAGRKKMGKTTLAGTISCNLNSQKIKHLYIAGEMGEEQIHQRNLSRRTDTFSSAFRTNYGRSEQFQNKIREQIDLSNESTIYLNAPGITFDELRRMVAQAISVHRIQGFILDSLQLVTGVSSKRSRVEHQDEVAQWLADYSRQQNIFNITTAQMNQEGNIRFGEGIRLACDQAYEIRSEKDDPSRTGRYLEMIETRYTAWTNIGTDTSPGLMINDHGPYFYEPDYGQPDLLSPEIKF